MLSVHNLWVLGRIGDISCQAKAEAEAMEKKAEAFKQYQGAAMVRHPGSQ